jgi:MraZ protein
VFRGHHEHAIDAKGRTSVPSRFRDQLARDPLSHAGGDGELRIIVTAGVDPCLLAYPMKEWLAFEEKLASLPRFDPSVVMIRRLYVSSAVEVEVDKLGRLLVPKELRDLAGLEREALWAGMGDHLELWSKERFEAARRAALATDDKRLEISRRLAELGL